VVDPSFWALDLGYPTSVVAEAPGYDPTQHVETFPPATVITYEFPAKGGRGPVKLVWYDGEAKPPRPADLEADDFLPPIGAAVVGDRGTIVHGSHGAGSLRIVPFAKMEAYPRPPQRLPRVAGHGADFVEAIRTGRPAGSNFDYAVPLTEIALLGVIASLFPGQKLAWDGAAGRFTNHEAANAHLDPPRRSGWELPRV
jgi:hypothetical protein